MLNLEQSFLFDVEEYIIPDEEPEVTTKKVNPEKDLKGNYSLNATLDEKIEGAIQSCRMVMQQGYTAQIFSSYGKDSSLLCVCGSIALEQEIAAGNTDAKLVIASSLVGGGEAPTMKKFMLSSIQKVEDYAEKHNLPIVVKTVSPSLSENFMLQMLIGRSSPSHVGQNRTCSISLKESPLNRLGKSIEKEFPNRVGLLGTYYRESQTRYEKMCNRGDRPDCIRTDDDGARYLSPLAAFTQNEVMELVGRLSLVSLGIPTQFGKNTLTDCIVDMGAVASIYTDASSASCSIEALADEGVKGSTACNSRMGCHFCVQIGKEDKSAKNIVENTGDRTVELLLNVRQALKASQFDLTKRTWLFKAVTDEGKIKLEPGSLSPQFIKNLWSWWLTVQAETNHEIFSSEEVLWVAANWSRYGISTSTEAIAIWHRIMILGERFYPSDEDMTPPPKIDIPRGEFYTVIDDQYGLRENGWFDQKANTISEITNLENSSEKELFPEIVNQLEAIGFSNQEAINIALIGKRSLERLELKEQTSYIQAKTIAEKLKVAYDKKLSKAKPLLPKRNGMDEIDAAFVLHQFSGEIFDIHVDYPDMSPSDSYKVLSTKYGVNMFNSAGIKETERMLQRANLIHRLGMTAHLNNPEKLIEILEKKTGVVKKRKGQTFFELPMSA